MKGLVFFLLIFLNLLSYSQLIKDKLHQSEFGIIGNVKSLKEEKFWLEKKNGEFKKNDGIINGGIYNKIELFQFDTLGRVIEQKLYRPKDEMQHLRLYKYDATGKCIEQYHKNFNSSWGVKNTSTQYVYDTMDNIISLYDVYNHSDTSSTTTFNIEYDEFGNVIEKQKYWNENGEAIEVSKYKYDHKGRVILLNNFTYVPHNKISKYKYKYNEQGDTIYLEKWDNLFDIKDTYDYQHDSLGRKIKEIKNRWWITNFKYDELDNLIEKTTNVLGQNKELFFYSSTKYIYTYDYNNNWITMTVDNKYEPYLVERKIEYY